MSEHDHDSERDTDERTTEMDSGTAEADDLTLDPWGSATVEDYQQLFSEFGIESFESVLPDVSSPHYLMRRGVIFGHREYDRVLDGLATGEAAVLSGFMPTGEPHIGHKLVFDEIIWHQRQGADAYGLIADLEAHSARGLDWDEIDQHARDYLLSLLALGFDPEEGTLYRQSENRAVQDLAFELGIETNASELQAIYGFDGETDVSHMQSVVTQMADILYPQLEEPKPTVIPVGPDQDPHVRLARDLAARMRSFKVTKAYASFEADSEERELIEAAYEALGGGDTKEPIRCVEAADWIADHRDAPDLEESLRAAGKEPIRPRVRFLDRNASDDAFTALINAIDGEKRVYEGHIDAFEYSREAATELAREIEIEHDGYGFYPPSSIYHRFMTGLTGGKMSSSVPASHISLLDDPEDGYDKVNAATTAGRETAELHRKLGGEADECPVYELYAYLLAGDDDDLAKTVYDECVNGERLCGDCKEQAAQLMKAFLEDHQEKREEAEELLESLDVAVDV
ncbi:tryptophan--tRNA ligase [Halocatena salina]|uniref:Tryptophan--tRNA ligase n=1 Tax=Halocatena salina TaxID=2934340 RepID=A0A8T9ZYW1_9EURY|nr:tryptophan--tRNA ligase [Halocatena salina]UPM41910.1 tryptophan--tRNA ligase [Halocatena salina]